MHDKSLVSLLARFYPGLSFLSIGKARYPVSILAAADSQITSINSVLGILDREYHSVRDETLDITGNRFVSALLNEKVHLDDLPTFCLKDMTVDASGAIMCECYVDTYFRMLRTCETIAEEARAAVRGEAAQPGNANLPLRSRIGPIDDSAGVFGRAPFLSRAIGISTLIVFRKKNTFALMIGRRGLRGVAVERGGFHVIPACMFQPIEGEYVLEYDIEYNIVREYLEELFSIERGIGAPLGEDPNIRFLLELKERGNADLYFTGIAWNMLSLRPEICALLFIGSSDWYDRHAAGDKGLAAFAYNGEWSSLDVIELDRGPSRYAPETFLPPDITPPGAGAVALAFDCMKRLSL